MVLYDENEYEIKKKNFEREYKRVEPYKTRRILTSDNDLKKEYKEKLIEAYNEIINTISPTFNEHQLEEKLDIQNKIVGHLSKLKQAFSILKLEYSFSKNIFDTIDKTQVIEEGNSVNESDLIDTLNSSTFSNNMAQTAKDFISMANHMINYKFAGDPITLDSFIDAIELLQELCEPQNKNLLLKFIMTRLEGLARESIVGTPQSADEIITQLRVAIKTESSKVIEGRILALRADKTSLIKFSEQAEKLAEQFRRSLVIEGFSKEKAKEIAIEKTVDMCRKSARNDTVKAVLAATKFSEPKEVIAKMIVEINNIKQDKAQNSYTHKHNNSNKNNHNNKNGSNNRNNNKTWNKHNNDYGNSSKSTNGSNHQNNNNKYNQKSYTNNNYKRGNDQTVRHMSGNEVTPGDGGILPNQ